MVWFGWKKNKNKNEFCFLFFFSDYYLKMVENYQYNGNLKSHKGVREG
jgi:hypothetical protein